MNVFMKRLKSLKKVNFQRISKYHVKATVGDHVSSCYKNKAINAFIENKFPLLINNEYSGWLMTALGFINRVI